MLADEIQQHPEFPHIFWPLKAEQDGKVAVADGRGGPFNIYYEVHGHGATRTVWIMGLGTLAAQWQRQIKDFGHTRGDRYSCLVHDNRGIGQSDTPLMRYSTSEMARDTLEVIDSVGWKDDRQLHVLGISLGGMIAQELAYLIPHRIASLTLISTAGALRNTIGFFENLSNRISLFIPKSVDKHIAKVKWNVMSKDYIYAPDDMECIVQQFPTNGDRYAATEVWKRSSPGLFNAKGFVLQAIASGWHYKSPEQLREIGEKVGRQRIQVIHGTADRMITFPHAQDLLDGLGGEEGEIMTRLIEGQGHIIPIEMRKDFTRWAEELVQRTEQLEG